MRSANATRRGSPNGNPRRRPPPLGRRAGAGRAGPYARGRTRGPESGCPVETALAAVPGRWTTLVLRELMHGAHSFGDLREALPRISPKVLAERPRALAERGPVTRDWPRGFPVRTRYRLTPAGCAPRPLLIELYRAGSALAEERGGGR